METLFNSFLKLEHFLKHSEPFTSQCMNLKHKTDFVAEQYESIAALIKQLETLKVKEQFASVEVMTDVQEKMAEVQMLKLEHNKVLIESEQQTDEIEGLLDNKFNELDAYIENVDFLIDIAKVVDTVQPETDKVLKGL